MVQGSPLMYKIALFKKLLASQLPYQLAAETNARLAHWSHQALTRCITVVVPSLLLSRCEAVKPHLQRAMICVHGQFLLSVTTDKLQLNVLHVLIVLIVLTICHDKRV